MSVNFVIGSQEISLSFVMVFSLRSTGVLLGDQRSFGNYCLREIILSAIYYVVLIGFVNKIVFQVSVGEFLGILLIDRSEVFEISCHRISFVFLVGFVQLPGGILIEDESLAAQNRFRRLQHLQWSLEVILRQAAFAQTFCCGKFLVGHSRLSRR